MQEEIDRAADQDQHDGAEDRGLRSRIQRRRFLWRGGQGHVPAGQDGINRFLLAERQDEIPLEAVAEWQFADRMICYHTEDHLEAAKAFLEKREPAPYKGK